MEVVRADTRTSSSTAPCPNGHVVVTVEEQGALRAPEPCSPASCVKTPESQQDAAQSVPNCLSNVQLKSEQDEKSGEMSNKILFIQRIQSKNYMLICLTRA